MAKKKIIVVEDNQILRETIGLILEGLKYEVLSFSDGLKAWQVIEAGEPFDLVISDYKMPNMNGEELLKLVRAGKNNSRVPFILWSGGYDTEDSRSLEKVCTENVAKYHLKDVLKLRKIIEGIAA